MLLASLEIIPCPKLLSQCSALCFIHSLNKCSLSSFPVPGTVLMLEIKPLKEIDKVLACLELMCWAMVEHVLWKKADRGGMASLPRRGMESPNVNLSNARKEARARAMRMSKKRTFR